MTHQADLPRDLGGPLPPPRFSLRTLWIVMTALCCLFAVMAAIGLWLSAVLALFLSLLMAHVLGNSLGTRLRNETSRQIAVERGATSAAPVPIAWEVVAPKRLTQRTSLHRITLLMGIGGALVGGELGGVGFAAMYEQAPASAVALGVVSAGVLGAFAGFLASSFLSVVRQALAEAHQGANTPLRPRVAAPPR
jgi:hypothetical protein